jgi:hypothetical protein
VIHVEPEAESPRSHSSTNDSTLSHQDSSPIHSATPSLKSSLDTHTPDASTSSTPFVVLEKVTSKDPPVYGDVEHESLGENAAKRTADAEPDFETVLPETPQEKQNELASPPVPIVIVEKTDDSPSHGDDFGKDATSAQKVAHELRAADATPDEVIVSPDPEPNTPELPAGALVDAGLETQSKPSEGHAESHAADNEFLGDLNKSPLMAHETRFPGEDPNEVREVGDELDSGPLLPHEVGGNEDTHNDNIIDKSHDDEFAVNSTHPISYGSDAPLFPHERDSRETGRNGSVVSVVSGGEPTFPYEAATESPMFGNPQYFLHRTSINGTLPQRLPRSDEEDEDLKDHSLERFPTNREQILERVATISSHLPVDETREPQHPQPSPEFSVQSQACSSIDLKPTTSYTSLKPVDEEEDLDEEEDDINSDSGNDDHFAMEVQSREVIDATKMNGTAPSDLSESTESSRAKSSSRSLSSSEKGSVRKIDGAHESSRVLGTVYGSIATPAKMLNPLTPPLTPERKVPTSDTTDDGDNGNSASRSSQDTEETPLKPRADAPTTTSATQDPGSQKESSFGALVNFLMACFGGRKQAR